MARIVLADLEGTLGLVEHEGGAFAGPIPPLCGERLAVYERLLAEGVTPEPYRPPPPPVPDEVALFKARYVLGRRPAPSGDGSLLDAARAAIAGLPDEATRALAAEALDYANTVSRHGALVALLGQQLGLADPEIDDLFRQADAVVA